MRRAFAAVGIDFDQWKALTIVALKLDLRGTASAQRHFRPDTSFVAAIVFQLVFYTLFSALIAFVVWSSRDPLLIGTIAATYIAFVIGTAVVIDHNSVIASPVDYGILGFRPVSSRTYFAVKLTNILVYTTAITTIASWLPIVIALLRHGGRVGTAMALDMYGASTGATLGIALVYATVLRVAGPQAIERVMSYVQLVMSFAVYGSQLLISRGLSRAAISSLSMPESPWLLLYPGTWFGSYLELASGRVSLQAVGLSFASIALLAAMATRLGGRLSLAYSERLGAMLTAARAAQPRRRARSAVWFRTGEARAVALLVRSQFRNDNRFRMGVLGVLPVTLFYLYIGIRDNALVDPFVPGGSMSAWPISLGVLMSPGMLRTLLTRSDSYRASWVFFTCPGDHTQIARALKNVLIVFFLIPYLILVFALYSYLTGQPLHVAVHLAFLGLIGHLIAQISILIDPSLPFSKPMVRSMGSTILFVFTMTTIALSALIQFFAPRLYNNPTWFVVSIAIVLGVGVVVDRLTHVRIERQSRELEFEG